jgi:ABC-type transport system involved in cytochrome bd biosynthesis fused ATPase/permease subunit
MCHVPLNFIFCTSVLFYYFGYTFLFYPFCVLIFTPALKWFTKQEDELKKALKKDQKKTNNLLNETLGHAKMLKLFGWQNKFRDLILQSRQEWISNKQKEINFEISAGMAAETVI